ncbi:hypothetical protein [Legionella gresilensis]|uniref:hypothetical protein n=1 Tax=Legionella gresilensis TaxID=91823 RepID=UPI001040E2FF|nr:hypothetical protein [Legionella gresilensis]
MIILYIPFERANNGNLGEAAQIWKNNYQLHKEEEIKIIYYQDDFDAEDIEPNSLVYILAHGADNDPNILANFSSADKASIINIGQLVSRFEFDFLSIIHKIHRIYLYCCGTEQKNRLLAGEFQHSLLRAGYTVIHFYQGKIYAPDELGRFLTEKDNKIISAIPFNLPLKEENLDSLTSYTSIKKLTRLTHDDFVNRSRQSFLNKNKEIKYEKIWALRKQAYRPENISTAVRPVLNSPTNNRQRFFSSSQSSTKKIGSIKSTILSC